MWKRRWGMEGKPITHTLKNSSSGYNSSICLAFLFQMFLMMNPLQVTMMAMSWLGYTFGLLQFQ